MRQLFVQFGPQQLFLDGWSRHSGTGQIERGLEDFTSFLDDDSGAAQVISRHDAVSGPLKLALDIGIYRRDNL